jgi:hypothetical protein
MRTNPQRLTIQRRKHYNLQEQSQTLNGLDAVNCSKPNKFGNPFRLTEYSLEDSLRLFRELIQKNDSGTSFVPLNQRHFNSKHIQEALRGKNLACWCLEGNQCHCDILLEVANSNPQDK